MSFALGNEPEHLEGVGGGGAGEASRGADRSGARLLHLLRTSRGGQESDAHVGGEGQGLDACRGRVESALGRLLGGLGVRLGKTGLAHDGRGGGHRLLAVRHGRPLLGVAGDGGQLGQIGVDLPEHGRWDRAVARAWRGCAGRRPVLSERPSWGVCACVVVVGLWRVVVVVRARALVVALRLGGLVVVVGRGLVVVVVGFGTVVVVVDVVEVVVVATAAGWPPATVVVAVVLPAGVLAAQAGATAAMRRATVTPAALAAAAARRRERDIKTSTFCHPQQGAAPAPTAKG